MLKRLLREFNRHFVFCMHSANNLDILLRENRSQPEATEPTVIFFHPRANSLISTFSIILVFHTSLTVTMVMPMPIPNSTNILYNEKNKN